MQRVAEMSTPPRLETFPRRLKPKVVSPGGTTKVVPYPKHNLAIQDRHEEPSIAEESSIDGQVRWSAQAFRSEEIMNELGKRM